MPFTLDSIADLDSVTARRAAATEAAKVEFAAIEGLRYGPEACETLDLYLVPDHAGAAPGLMTPVLVFVHGGFWSTMRAAQFAFVAAGFVPFGVALAVIDYPLIPQVRMADIVAACRRALVFLHRHGETYGLDPDRIHVAGNSAGGHLVAELMDRAWTAESGVPIDVIKGGVAISGLFDLAPVAASSRNELLGFTAAEVELYSPLRRRLDIAAPLIVAVGGDETGEFLRQSAAFAEQVRVGGSAVTHLEVAGTNHITVVLDAFAVPGTGLNVAARRQMGLPPG